MRRVHLVFGAVGVLAFVLTGQYMDRVHAHLEGMPDAPRMLYRSAHIYLLLAALMNLLLGAYLRPSSTRGARVVQTIASLALLATPVLFLVAFAVEPGLEALVRPWARPAIELSLAATLAHVLAAYAAPPAQSELRSTSAASLDAAPSAGASSAPATTTGTTPERQA